MSADLRMPEVRGRVAYVFEEPHFNADAIIGGFKNIGNPDLAALASIAMAGFDPDFAASIRKGDLLVGGANFGYGHPHYPPMRVMRHMGIGGVLAESFSPGFWRGEISMGFPVLNCLGILGFVKRWDEVSVDWEAGLVRNLTAGTTLPFEPLSKSERLNLMLGGLEPYIRYSRDHLQQRAGGAP